MSSRNRVTAQNTKGLKGQGHTSRSSAKVTYLCTALRLLLLNKHKKFEDDAVARFAVGSVNRSGGKKNHGDHSNNNTDREYLSVSKTILTESTSRSVIIYFKS